MRTSALALSTLALVCLAGPAFGAKEPLPPAPPADRRFTALLGLEASVVGFSLGPRAELLYRLGAPGSVSHLRTTTGALIGPEFVFVPVGVGYRAVFRQDKTVQPLVGLGYEAHCFFTHEGPVFAQWATVYLEGGVGFALDDRFSLGGAVSADWSFANEPGPGLQGRLFGGMRF